MLATLKAKLRAWLIDLIREAFRTEWRALTPTHTALALTDPVGALAFSKAYRPKSQAINQEPVQVEPSFEQMQAEALKEQEKFYEPKRA